MLIFPRQHLHQLSHVCMGVVNCLMLLEWILPSTFHIKYNTTPNSRFFHQIVLRLLLSHHQANRKYLSFGISDRAKTAHGSDCAVTSLSVTRAGSLGERCHSLGERCHFLSKHGSLPRSLLRTTNGFGFRASTSRRTMP